MKQVLAAAIDGQATLAAQSAVAADEGAVWARRNRAATHIQGAHQRWRSRKDARALRLATAASVAARAARQEVEAVVRAIVIRVQQDDELERAHHAQEEAEQRASEMEAMLLALRAEQQQQVVAHAAELAALHEAAEVEAQRQAEAEAAAAAQHDAAQRIQRWWRRLRWGRTIKKLVARQRAEEAAALAEQARVRAELEEATAKVRAESEAMLQAVKEEAAALKQQGEQQAVQAAEIQLKLEEEQRQRAQIVHEHQQKEVAAAAEQAEEVRQLVEAGGPPPGAGAEAALEWAEAQEPTKMLQQQHAAAWLALLHDAGFEGWLVKRGARGLKKGWKRRWFTLSGSSLSYYARAEVATCNDSDKAASEQKLKGEIDLSGCLKIRPSEGGKERPFELELVYDTRVYRLAAEDKPMFCKWLAVLSARYSVAAPAARASASQTGGRPGSSSSSASGSAAVPLPLPPSVPVLTPESPLEPVLTAKQQSELEATIVAVSGSAVDAAIEIVLEGDQFLRS
eukprot:SAG22_NODE_144_length_17700_cov_21.959207_1_plen_512_part_00